MRITRRQKSVRSQAGVAMVEAAVALPIFLGILFLSIKILMASYKMLRLQDIVAEVTREAFTKTSTERGALTWQEYIKTNLFNRAKAAGVSKANEAAATKDTFWNNISRVQTPTDPATARIGDTYSLSISVPEPVFSGGIGGISLVSIPLKAKAVAVVQMRQNQ